MNKENKTINPLDKLIEPDSDRPDTPTGTMTKEKPILKKTKYGFYQYSPLPSKEEMQEYYSQKYYQEGKGSYEVSYTDDEIKYFRLKADLIYKKLNRIRPFNEECNVLDIGCGEGWAMGRFLSEGHNIAGMDYSDYGLKTFNSQLLPYLEKGDFCTLLDQKVSDGQKYEIILLGNVIEHVLDPVALLEVIDKILSKDGVLVIVAPNDFSPLQEHLMNKEIIDKPFWLHYPDHISYFNKESMENLLKSKGFSVEAVVADNPIDLNLLNKNSNYIMEPQKGKNTHYFRVDEDNFLASISEDKLLDIYESLGSMGVGRDLTYYCMK